MKTNLSKIENILNSTVSYSDVLFDGVSTDSRTVVLNNLFIPLSGDKYDGHDYIDDAVDNGAVAIISEKALQDIPHIKVNNTLNALNKISSYYLQEINPTVISVTGTNGKTTVTDMTARITSNFKKTLKTYKNFNNNIGLPLSILQAKKSDEIFVLEMGASKRGDIKELVEIARPQIVALLNVSEAHLETFESLENILLTKEEIFLNQGYKKTVILNKDDQYYDRWVGKNNTNNIKTISLTEKADYTAIDISSNSMSVKTPYESEFQINITNNESFHLMNLLFSIALACESGARSHHIIPAFKNYNNVEGRFRICNGFNNSSIIDSSYNANPASFRASIDSLMSMGSNSWVIMGQMGELGAHSEKHHVELAHYAAKKGVEKLFVLTEHNEAISQAFNRETYSFSKKSDLVRFIKPLLKNNTNVLIKASRYMKFETIVDELIS